MKKRVQYGPSHDDYVVVETVSDELRFVECMKLYKTHETLGEIEGALSKEAKEKIRLTY
jgi:hypothetical protein|tara:strand:- start:209 stop:385 length:177 start_codon:yes stop_codon:yes gene_type:complete